MSEAGPSEPVEATKQEAPVAEPVLADADAPQQDVQAQPEALPTASKKTERKISRMEDKADMDRKVMRTKIDEMDRNILDLQSQIDKEEDTGKQAKMRDNLAEKVADREVAYAEYKTMTAELDAKTEAIRKELAKIQLAKAEIADLKAFIDANKATLDKAKILLLADKTRALDEKEKDFKKMCPEGHEDDLKATLKAYEAEQLHVKEEAERRDEIGEADRTLAREMAIALGETPPPEPEPKKTEEEKKPEEKKAEQAPVTKEEKELILDNKIDQIAFDLAKMLAGNVPKEDDTIGKFTFEAKRGLLMVMTFLGGDPTWTDQLTPDEKKDLGMTVTTKLDDKGQTLHIIKWEPLDLTGNTIQDVYEAAFGKEGWNKQMALLKPTTTVKELQDKVAAFPKDTTDPEQKNMIKFVDALVSSGATPESGVQDYIIKNGDKVIKILKPETAAVAGAEGKETAKVDLAKLIQDNSFDSSTKVGTVLKAVDKTLDFGEDFTDAAQVTKAATAKVDGFKTSTDINTFSDSAAKMGKAVVALGLPDPSLSLVSTCSKASSEISTPAGLSAETKAELQAGVENYLTLVQGYKDTRFMDVLKKRAESATGDDLKNVEAARDALQKNPTPEASPAK